VFDFIKDSFKRFMNKNFMDAAVAGCALVAVADGKIDAAEKQKMVGLMQHIEELKVFPVEDVVSTFNKFVDILQFDEFIGKEELFKVLRKIKGNEDESKMVVRMCCSIGAADGNFDDDEKVIVRRICEELNLDVSRFSELGL